MHYKNLAENKQQTTQTTRAALLNKSLRTDEDSQSITIEMKQLSSNQSESVTSRVHSIGARSQLQVRKRNRTQSRIKILEEKSQSRVKDQDGFTVGYGVEEVKYHIAGKDKKKNQESSYDMWDLTYTLITAKVPFGIVTFLFLIFVLIRYYTFACLIYMAAHSDKKDIWWIFVIIADRLLYMFLVMKISLETPETRTQIVLKSHWNSKQSSINEYFEVIDAKKFITSIIRGLIPAQLAFIYIRALPRRRFQLYTAINYINASIEAIIYYPFFIIYCYLLTSDNTFALNQYYQGATIGLAAFAEFMMMVATIILVVLGAKKKYRKFQSCL